MAIRLNSRVFMFAGALISMAVLGCGTTGGPVEEPPGTGPGEVAAVSSSPSAASVASTDSRCPLTVANESVPPGETTAPGISYGYHGDGVLWTRLPSGATVQPDGALRMKLHGGVARPVAGLMLRRAGSMVLFPR